MNQLTAAGNSQFQGTASQLDKAREPATQAEQHGANLNLAIERNNSLVQQLRTRLNAVLRSEPEATSICGAQSCPPLEFLVEKASELRAMTDQVAFINEMLQGILDRCEL